MRTEIIRKKGDVDIKDIKSFVKLLANRYVTVGVHKAEGSRKNSISGTKVIDYACYNEFGHEGHPPERSFVRRLAHDNEAKQDIKDKQIEEMKKISKAHYKGNKVNLINNLYGEIGKVALKRMTFYIENPSTFIGNAERTVKNKGFDHPLLDTGLLVKSLKAKVRGGTGRVLKVVAVQGKEYTPPEMRER